ncbi:MAG: hypothetical protein JRC53_02830, partial [Deltaproteobacteria bacterium]|nr:hypothetical protein [Deltaproteobacteria bacterium]
DHNNLVPKGLALQVQDLDRLSGGDITKRILESATPAKIVQSFSEQDFFWLMKKAGEEEYLPLLKLASTEQRQYILDMELWTRDQIKGDVTFEWLERIKKADPDHLAWWLFNEGQDLAHLILFRNIDVIVKGPDEELDLPDEFFTNDDVIYIRVINYKHYDTIRKIIELLFREDENYARNLIEEVASIIPAEIEEDMYRQRTTRLAEAGFLPFDEASSVFSPLGQGILETGGTLPRRFTKTDEEIRSSVPVLPLLNAGAETMFARALSDIDDASLIDRARLEFAGLCNRITAAEGLGDLDPDILREKCRKAGGYINIALEKVCGSSVGQAEELIQKNSLESLFRVGFGYAMKLKWKAESWINRSWFSSLDLDTQFWGTSWGMTLMGLTKEKPLFYTGIEEEKYRSFEKLPEINAAEDMLDRVMVLDDFLRHLHENAEYESIIDEEKGLEFYPLIFSFWARLILNLKPNLSGLSLEEAKTFLKTLREGEDKPPYKMEGFEEKFIADLSHLAPEFKKECLEVFRDTLSQLWRKFKEEFESVPTEALDARYSRFLLIRD